MKRIYLFAFLMILFAGSAMAQRTANLSIKGKMGSTTTNKVAIQNGQTITVDTGKGGSVFYYGWDVTNAGPADLIAGDTVFIKTAYSGQKVRFIVPAAGIKASTTISIFPVNSQGQEIAIKLVPGTEKSSVNNSYQWCDSVWAVSGPNTAITDNQSDNRSCATIKRVVNAMSIGDINANSASLSFFPNPANDGVVSLKFNFGNNTNAAVVIRDVTGKTVMGKELGAHISGVQEYKLDINNLNAGLYLVELNVSGQKVMNKLIVQ